MAGIFIAGEKMVNEMIYEITSNQSLLKYIAYDDIKIDPSTKSDVPNPTDLIFTPEKPTPTDLRGYRIFNIPKAQFVEEDKKTIVACYITKTEPAGSNQNVFGNYYICFDVVCHVDLWGINGGIIRPLRICDGINDVFNRKYSASSLRPLYPEINTFMNWDSKGIFCGYRLIYKASAKIDSCGSK